MPHRTAKIPILFTSSLLILTLFPWPSSCANNIKNCLIDALIEGFQLNKEHYKALQVFLNEEDFENTITANKDTIRDILDMEDMSLNSQLQMMLTFTVKSEVFKTALLKCRPDSNKAKDRCEAYYGEGNCAMLDDYVWATKCPYGFRSIGLEFCVPNCPSGFADIEDDPFYCQKLSEIQRSWEFYDKKKNPPLRIMVYRGLESPVCPQYFQVFGVDFCRRNCPIGWGDLGQVCQKPSVLRRKNEIFIFDFAIDDYIDEEIEKEDSQELANFNTLTR